MTGDYIITLVHGTFARAAEWTRPSSFFTKTLREQFPSDASVLIEPFEWSGRNSPWSRSKAARNLRSLLENMLYEYPDASHYVVGHSHGGNIALQAVLGSIALKERVSVATLATPYIHVRQARHQFGQSNTLTWMFLVPWLVLTAWSSLYVTIPLYETSFYQVLVLGIPVITALVGLFIANRVANAIIGLGVRVRESLTLSVPSRFDLLVVRYVGDEASAFLTVSQFLAWLVGRVWSIFGHVLSPVIRALKFFERKRRWIPVLVSAFALNLVMQLAFITALYDVFVTESSPLLRVFYDLLDAFRSAIVEPSLESVLTSILAALILLGFGFLLVVLVWPGVFMLTLALLPFGPESVLAALFGDISVEEVPEGTWTVHQFVEEGGGQLQHTGLVHSAAYNDSRVIRLLALWIREAQTSTQADFRRYRSDHVMGQRMW